MEVTGSEQVECKDENTDAQNQLGQQDRQVVQLLLRTGYRFSSYFFSLIKLLRIPGMEITQNFIVLIA